MKFFTIFVVIITFFISFSQGQIDPLGNKWILIIDFLLHSCIVKYDWILVKGLRRYKAECKRKTGSEEVVFLTNGFACAQEDKRDRN